MLFQNNNQLKKIQINLSNTEFTDKFTSSGIKKNIIIYIIIYKK